ncbi:MAG: hypothetical protein ABR599_00470 [Gemmatimonadota bacterium]
MGTEDAGLDGLFSIEAMRRREARGLRRSEDPRAEASRRVLVLFLVVVLGVFTKWFWEALWIFVADPAGGLPIGSPAVLAARLAISFIVAALTFVAIYNKIDQSSGESWAPYLLAFQNGFFWQATFDAVARLQG